jgi:hypothetical protein
MSPGHISPGKEFKMNRSMLFATTLSLILVACASSGPTISVNSAPGADLSRFKTFDFIQPLGTDRNSARTALSTMLVDSTTQELLRRGLTQSDTPDLLVDFFVTTEERLDVRTTPSSSSMHRTSRSHWNSGCCSTWPSYQTRVRQYTQGTLLIDLIDPAANALVSEGAAQDRIRGDEITRQEINDIVGQIMAGMLGP